MKKIKGQKGFTLVEMLACVVTLLLLAGICTTGTNLAMNSYNRSLFESNSQMLESTLETYLNDIMRHATLELGEALPAPEADPSDPEASRTGNKKVVSITNPSYGMYGGWVDVSDEGRFYIHKTEADTLGVQILSENVYTGTMKISDFSVQYNETGKYVTGSYTIESTVVSGLSRECSFKCRVQTSD